ncbi:hypothetical protein GWK47_039232 [Chionoecetes opilio]|uniref:Uncharacterized protein n=1 Tax=Chionoecetes opilio TaxID=41210 RepID=A0A8J4YM49_CHIOP|nr:hypothetical protein GWK47_039232 [Chionoecetes opilio]
MCQDLLLAQRKAWGSHCASLPHPPPQRYVGFFPLHGGEKTTPLTAPEDGANPLLMTRRRLHCLPHTIRTRLVSGLLSLIPYINAAIKTAVFPPLASRHSPVLSRLMRWTGPVPLRPGKTAGRGNVPYEFLLHMTPPLKSTALSLFKTSWLRGVFPTFWKSSTLLPIKPKPGRTPNSRPHTAYRSPLLRG